MKEWKRKLEEGCGQFFASVVEMALHEVPLRDVKVENKEPNLFISFRYKNLSYQVKITYGMEAFITLVDPDPLTLAIVNSKMFQQELHDKHGDRITVYPDFKVKVGANVWTMGLGKIIVSITDTVYKYAERIGKTLTDNPTLIDAILVSDGLD